MRQISLDYFDWLVSQIKIGTDKTYNGLFEKMHVLEFIWTVPKDDNRVRDGIDLRNEFLNENRYSRKEITQFYVDMQMSASVLEVLIGLSRRVAFTAGGTPEFWAWMLIQNLRLDHCSDPLTPEKTRRIDDTLDALIWRTYQRDGQGGFFPLNWAEEDQRKIEIWYQMNKYVSEIQEP